MTESETPTDPFEGARRASASIAAQFRGTPPEAAARVAKAFSVSQPNEAAVRGLANFRGIKPTQFPPSALARIKASINVQTLPAGWDRGVQDAIEKMRVSSVKLGAPPSMIGANAAAARALRGPSPGRLELERLRRLPTPVVKADIAAVEKAVHEHTGAITDQTGAIVALHRGVEVLADRSDNRSSGLVWLTVILAAYAIVDLFLR